ncbi:DUF2510 domain-containing protein [Microbacterium yannicii]|uniref:DUF2510 domain-containing protein n=1 Tax=Microbacterium yannicii TaxID=671622 RepID=UPI00035E2644|nr:DUF2510 domain-containing protein [Microbacterium yannicii]
MTTTPPGWYDDGHGAMRWWDGSQWTEHVAAPDAETTDAPSEAEIVAASEGGAAPDPVANDLYPAAVPAAGVPSPAGALDYQAYSAADPAAALFQVQGADPAQSPAAVPGAGTSGQPEADASGGAFTAATDGRRSKLWILWLVLGMVLLGIVIAAAVLIPLSFLNAAGNGGASSADEEAAVAAVEQYDQAWQNADCEAFNAATTENFRTEAGFTDCAAFEAEAQAFDTNFDDYQVNIDEIESDGDVISVTTTESYIALIDDTGAPIETGEAGSTIYHYTLVPADDGWAIDVLTYE